MTKTLCSNISHETSIGERMVGYIMIKTDYDWIIKIELYTQTCKNKFFSRVQQILFLLFESTDLFTKV